MGFLTFLIIFLILFVLYLIYSSHFSQILIRKRIKKDFINRLKRKVKGVYLSNGYFAASHKIITQKEFNSFSNKDKLKYSSCYNVIKFKTEESIFLNKTPKKISKKQ